MTFVFDARPSDSSIVDMVWRTQSEGGGSFISSAAGNVEMVITRQQGVTTLSIRGPETKASPAPIPEDAEFLGITFKLGAFLPSLPANELVNGGVHLADASRRTFCLQGSTWQFPNFENADTFVEQLIRQGLLARDPIVEAALQGRLTDLSERSVQRRFRRVTGVTHGVMAQIERARYAQKLLEQGLSILDTVEQAGYYDQPHMTRALKFFIGQTPAQILNTINNE